LGIIFRGDGALTLAIILLDTILAPFVVPFTTKVLLGTTVVFDSSGMAFSLIAMVVVPTVIGVALNELSKGSVPKMVGSVPGTGLQVLPAPRRGGEQRRPVAPKAQTDHTRRSGSSRSSA
jgi:predicted Na+-dependent transporter